VAHDFQNPNSDLAKLTGRSEFEIRARGLGAVPHPRRLDAEGRCVPRPAAPPCRRLARTPRLRPPRPMERQGALPVDREPVAAGRPARASPGIPRAHRPPGGQVAGLLHTDVAPHLKPGDHVGYLGDLDLCGGNIEANFEAYDTTGTLIGIFDGMRVAMRALPDREVSSC
jgi:hypothetical protein